MIKIQKVNRLGTRLQDSIQQDLKEFIELDQVVLGKESVVTCSLCTRGPISQTLNDIFNDNFSNIFFLCTRGLHRPTLEHSHCPGPQPRIILSLYPPQFKEQKERWPEFKSRVTLHHPPLQHFTYFSNASYPY